MQEIIDYFKANSDSRGIPSIANSDWTVFKEKYDQQTVRLALAKYITDHNIPFPLKEYSKDEFEAAFLRFANTSMLGEYKHFSEVHERADYKYAYNMSPLGVIDKTHAHNIVSNYFQQENRMKCGSNASESPWSIWHDPAKLEKMNWHFWRPGALGKSNVDQSTFRSAFRIGTYTATQFKPSVAKALYEKHGATKILDTSCGWGDRLAAFYATPGAKLYVGCDPNPSVFETYKKQCLEYERLLGGRPLLVEGDRHFTCHGLKSVEVWNYPSEDVDWGQYKDEFDFYFTSPPYYETERYGADNPSTQSWHRYPDFGSWKDDFFYRVNRMIAGTICSGGYMMINIIEPRNKKGTRLNLCDGMVDNLVSQPGMYYVGKIGMRMQARPHAIVGTSKNSVFVEPIWVFRKGLTDYPHISPENLFKFIQ